MKRIKTSVDVKKPVLKLESRDKIGAKKDDNLLQIFPAEIWLQILRDARSNDLLTIRQSSQFFGGLLTPIEFLFAAVLKCVIPYTSEDVERYCVLENCRLVCRSWCKAVNSILQDESAHVKIETRSSSIPPLHPSHLRHFCIKFFTRQIMLPKFEHHFKDTHLEKGKNPFVSRHMKIWYGSSRSKNSEYFLHLSKILKNCGHHIWYLNVVVAVRNLHNDFEELRGLLELLPNLKVLTVDNVQMYAHQQQSPQPNLEPFRNMSKLQCVKIYGDDTEPFLKALLAKNTQVKSLVFRQHSDSENDWVIPLPNLERLRVTSEKMKDFQQQIGHDQVHWPLKQLVVNLKAMSEVAKWQEMGRCFQILETKFGTTLQQLDLYFPRDCELNTKVALYLPNLTSLSLELKTCCSLDFLLPMRNNLKYLDITVDCTHLGRLAIGQVLPEKTIKFFTVDCPPKDTNIWKLFEKLEKLKYWHRFYHHSKRRTYYRENILMN